MKKNLNESFDEMTTSLRNVIKEMSEVVVEKANKPLRMEIEKLEDDLKKIRGEIAYARETGSWPSKIKEDP